MMKWMPVILSVGLVACGDGTISSDVTVTDSAGARIVMNPSFDAPVWSISADPVLELGTVEGEGPEQFFQITAAQRTVLNGVEQIIVANGGSSELRFFDMEGDFLRAIGARGEGPGELGAAGPFWTMHGDSLAVWDLRGEKLVVFDQEGEFARQISRVPVFNAEALALSRDGQLLVWAPQYDLSNAESFVMMEAHFARVSPDGERVDTLPSQPFGEHGMIGPDPPRSVFGTPLFAPRTWAAGDPDGYWVATGQDEQIARYGLEGTLQVLARWPAQDRRVPDEAVDMAIAQDLEEAPEERHAAIRQRYEYRPVADAFASTGWVSTGYEGEVWVQLISWPPRPEVSTWKVFSVDGRLTGQIDLPPFPAAFRILDVGEDYLLGVHQNELGVEYLRMYALERGEE